MNVLKAEKKLAVISALTEGCSIRSIVRMTGVHKKTIMKLLVEIGTKCEQMMNEKMHGIRCEAVDLPPINQAGSRVKISTGERREHGTQAVYGGRDHRAVTDH